MGKEIKVQSIGSLLEETVEEITIKASGIDVPKSEILSTGLLNLDEVLGGLRPSYDDAARGGTDGRRGKQIESPQLNL